MAENVLTEIEEMFGHDVASSILWNFAGVQVYFGKNPKETSLLVKAVGMDTAIEIGEYFGGAWVTIPSNKMAAKIEGGKEKADKIMECLADGLTIEDTAKRCNCSSRWVYIIQAKSAKDVDDGQLDLIDLLSNEAA